MTVGLTRRIQDSVHGLMDFSGPYAFLVDLLRASEVQRLRRIRQLGLKYLVFPGAEHSRFVHSLGVAFLARKFGEQLREQTRATLGEGLVPDEWAIRDLSIAALVHDLGHGPLSHVWDPVVGEFDKKAWGEAFGLDAARVSSLDWHELVTQGLLLWPEGELHRLLEGEEKGLAARIGTLLLGDYYLPFLPRLLASDVDADRADYIIRDAIHCGVHYGRYDVAWLCAMAMVGFRKEDGQPVFGFEKKRGRRVVEQVLIARRAMYDTVYLHKTVRAAEAMVRFFLKRFMEAGDKAAYSSLGGFVRPVLEILKGNTIAPQDMMRLDDNSLFVLISVVAEDDKADATLRELAKRFLVRNLFKEVPVADPERLNGFLFAGGYRALEETVQKCMPGLDARMFFHVDRMSFSFFSSGPRAVGYLVDDNGVAQEMSRDEELVRHVPGEMKQVLLYTVGEAVDSVARVIREWRGP